MSGPRASRPRHRSPMPFVVVSCVIATLGLAAPGDLQAQQELESSGSDETASDAPLIDRLLSDDELLLETRAGYPVASTLPEAAVSTGTAVILIETRPDGAAGRFSFTGVPACSNTEIVYCLGEDATLVAANLEAGTYTSTQVDPAPEFDVTDVRCDDGASPTPSGGDPSTRSAVFQIDPGETVTCSFVNTRRGTAIVRPQTDPSGSAGEFLFTGVPDCPWLDSDGEVIPDPEARARDYEGLEKPPCVPTGGTLKVVNLEPGVYTSTEADPGPEFDVTDVRCDDGDSPTPSGGDPSTRSAVFQIDPGETVTCTFVNSRRGTAASGDATLLAYLPFDGGIAEEAARGLETEVFAFGAGGVEPVEGRYGSAALFGGGSGILFPLDVDFGTHSKITVSMWVRVAREGGGERGFILSTGKAADHTPGLSFLDSKIVADAIGQRLIGYGRELAVGEWVHVAAVWDSDARTVRLYTGEQENARTGLEKMDPAVIAGRGRSHSVLDHPVDERKDPARWVVLGALSMNGFRPLEEVAVDEVRIYAGALAPEEIAAIRSAETPPPLGDVAPPPPEPERVAGNDGDNETGGRKFIGWTLADDYELSDVSGSEGTHLDADFGDRPIHKVEIYQTPGTQDRPCRVRVYSVDGNSETIEQPPCRMLVNTPVLEVDLGSDTPVNTLQVCQNNKRNERVKGLKLWGKRVHVDEDSGEIDFRESNAGEEDLPNCRDWKDAASCPSGSVASGIHAHFTRVRRTEMEQLVGLQLVCRDVVGVHR